MKRLRLLGVLLISLFLPVFVHAAGTISVSGPNSAVVNNTITVGVKLSTGDAWQVDLSYDKSLLQLTGSTAEGGGTYMSNTSVGNPSRSYTFKFKALKSGNAKIGIGSYDVVGNDEKSISMSGNTKTIKIQTQAELEASYSDDATLKSLSVDGYDISPAFDKQTYEYTLDVENNIEKINIVANKNNANARVEGDGEKELIEGNNKIEIVVTAQKGNSLTYTININRKELNPINVTINNKSYTLVRKADNLPKYAGFIETTVNYKGEDIPALLSEAINKTIVGVKDEDGNISTYVYEDGTFKSKYVELKSNEVSVFLIEKDSVPFKYFNKTNIKINKDEISAFKYKNLSNYYLVYGMDLSTGKEGYYLYDNNNNTFQLFDEELFNSLAKENDLYLYMFIGSLGVILICIIIILVILRKKGKRNKTEIIKEDKKKDKKIEKDPVKEEKMVKEKELNDNKKLDLLFEDIEEIKDEQKNKKKNKKAE